MRSFKYVLVLIVSTLLVSCITMKRTEKRENVVMVIDSDFDPKLDIYKNRILGQYTLNCSEKNPEEKIDWEALNKQLESMSDEDLLDFSLSNPDACRLEPSLKTYPQQSEEVMQIRKTWNNAVKSRDFSNISQDTIKLFTENFVYSHGTSTSSVIAYKNPAAKMVLVQYWQSADEAYDDDSTEEENTLEEEFVDACSDANAKSVIERYNKVMKSKAYREHHEKIPHSFGREIQNIADKHRVSLVNYSMGYLPIKFIREIFTLVDCEHLGEFFINDIEIRQKQIEASKLFERDFLFVQAAGNEATKIDSKDEIAACNLNDNNHMMIGAFDAYGKISGFSNYGKCVDYYTLGSQVITAAPGGVLFPVDGTSFSSPLVVRLISTSLKGKRLGSWKTQLNGLADQRKFLKGDAHIEKISFQSGVGKGLALTKQNFINFIEIRRKEKKRFMKRMSISLAKQLASEIAEFMKK